MQILMVSKIRLQPGKVWKLPITSFAVVSTEARSTDTGTSLVVTHTAIVASTTGIQT